VVKMENEEEKTKEELKVLIKKAGRIIYTNCEHVSQSGMTRWIDAFVIINNQPIHINHYIAKLGIFERVPRERGRGIVVTGCGADVGFEVVDAIRRAIYPESHNNYLTHKWL